MPGAGRVVGVEVACVQGHFPQLGHFRFEGAYAYDNSPRPGGLVVDRLGAGGQRDDDVHFSRNIRATGLQVLMQLAIAGAELRGCLCIHPRTHTVLCG